MTGDEWGPGATVSESIREVRRNIESMDRTFWRYGVPAILLAFFASGFALGFHLGVAIS